MLRNARVGFRLFVDKVVDAASSEDGPNLRSEASVLNSISVNKENFKQTIKAGSGQLAAEAKREEYQRIDAAEENGAA